MSRNGYIMLTMTTKKTKTAASELPVLMSLTDLAAALEGHVERQTVYRWNTSSGDRPKILPEPDLFLNAASRPMAVWFEDTLREWAAGRGYPKFDAAAMRKIRKAQGK